MKVLSVFGTRPELIKLSYLFLLLDKNFQHCMVHTGQHYSPALDKEIQQDLKMRKPDYQLKMKTGSFALQMESVMQKLEKILLKEKPHIVLVQGDTNSSLVGALVASRLGIPIAHVEAGCRSGNLLAPEEQNRRIIDSISTLFFAADTAAGKNLKKEGIVGAKAVGNTGIDTVTESLKNCDSQFLKRFSLKPGKYILATLHRAENTENSQILKQRLEVINYASEFMPVILAMHPRTKAAIKKFRIKLSEKILVTEPLRYLLFITLLKESRIVLSDSGGIQEEAAIVRRPCLVLRDETEWTRLVDAGRNFLCPELNPKTKKIISKLINDEGFYEFTRKRKVDELQVGASQKIIKELKPFFCRGRSL